jgi:nitrite reductase/ring-hydroxylating ferredoxin subunit
MATSPETHPLAASDAKENAFLLSDLRPGQVKRLTLAGRKVTVYNVGGAFHATQEECTHAGGPLSEGRLDGKIITCPWHGSCFDVTDGSVVCRPARPPAGDFHCPSRWGGRLGRARAIKVANNPWFSTAEHSVPASIEKR